jgi:hypothetical protein
MGGQILDCHETTGTLHRFYYRKSNLTLVKGGRTPFGNHLIGACQLRVAEYLTCSWRPAVNRSAPRFQKWAVTGATGKPSSAKRIAGASMLAMGNVPCRAIKSHHPAHDPGTVIV